MNRERLRARVRRVLPPFRQIASLLLVVAMIASSVLVAQYQKAPPDFGGSYAFPTPTHPEPRETWIHALDIVMLAAGLAAAAWLVLKRRTRNGVFVVRNKRLRLRFTFGAKHGTGAVEQMAAGPEQWPQRPQ